MSEIESKLRKMASIETSALYSQRVTLISAADRIAQLETALESAVAIIRGEVGSGWAERNEADWKDVDAALNPINH